MALQIVTYKGWKIYVRELPYNYQVQAEKKDGSKILHPISHDPFYTPEAAMAWIKDAIEAKEK